MPKDLYNSGRKTKKGSGFPLKRGAYETKVSNAPVCGIKYKSGDSAKDSKMSGDGLAAYAKSHKNSY